MPWQMDRMHTWQSAAKKAQVYQNVIEMNLENSQVKHIMKVQAFV